MQDMVANTEVMSTPDFRETGPGTLSPAGLALLSKRVSELSLQIPGTRLEPLIQQLYDELQAHGISFKPKCYLSDEWGCPQGVPVIGIPFYLADPDLSHLEGEMTGVEAEDETEVLMYLRHEAGHAFNYAYRLYAEPEWRQLFGPFSRPYRDHYRVDPFSTQFVRHIPGWYAQKHPDEDFAETFAVWLTPGSNWRERYANTPALTKLLYVDRQAERYGQQPALVTDETFDTPVEEIEDTLAEWYGTPADSNRDGLALPLVLNDDLRTLFPAQSGKPAIDLLRPLRRSWIHQINYWTGINRHLLGGLIDEMLERVQVLDLKVQPERSSEMVMGMTIFLTTLVMNYQRMGQFVKA